MNEFYGLYRGLVVDNNDPEQIKRLKVLVPAVSGDLPLAWAMPCIPNLDTPVLPIDSPVWIMFESGNIDHPVWMGTYPFKETRKKTTEKIKRH